MPGAPDHARFRDVADCQAQFREFALTAASRAPLYQRLASRIADDQEVAGLLLLAPPAEAIPVLLFACTHALLLADPDDELAAWYPNLTPEPDRSDPYPAFRRFCRRRRDALVRLLAQRVVQTNEVGRCALLVPAFAAVADETGPLAHVDVGASAGLNLLLPHYRYDYQPGGIVGPPSPVVMTCGTRGPVLVPAVLPIVQRSIGLDRAPIDVTDDDEARWLEACVWPDQLDRFARLRAAIELARTVGVDVRHGDAVAALAALVREAAAAGHPVVTNTWVLSYLSEAARLDYLAALDELGQDLDLSWVYAESPALIGGLPVPERPDAGDVTALMLVRWRAGRRDAVHLADCHPHGYWMHAVR